MADQPTEETSQTANEPQPVPTASSEDQPHVVESESTAVPTVLNHRSKHSQQVLHGRS